MLGMSGNTLTGEAGSFIAVLKLLPASAIPPSVASFTVDPAITRRNIEFINRLSYGYAIPEIAERKAILRDAIVELRVDYNIRQILNEPNHWFAGSRLATYKFDSSAPFTDQTADASYCRFFTVEPTAFAEEAVIDFDRSCLCENVDMTLKRDVKEAIVNKVEEIRSNPKHEHYEYLSGIVDLDKEACGYFITTTCTVTSGSQLAVPPPDYDIPDEEEWLLKTTTGRIVVRVV